MRGQRGADERPGSGDGGKMVADENPFAGGNEIVAVFQTFGWCGAGVVESEDFRSDEFGVEAIGDEVGAERGDDELNGVERLATFEGDGSKRAGSGESDCSPQNDFEDGFHISARAPGHPSRSMRRIVRKRGEGVNRELGRSGRAV